jgi:hypothetical protein
VPFGSSDVKALLAYHSTPSAGQRNTSTLGNQCKKRRVLGVEITTGCDIDEVNAGAFHIAMTNLIGLRHEGFVVDKDPTSEVWNQPVYGYRTTVESKASLSGGKSELTVTTLLDWADDEKPNWNPLNGTGDYKFETAILKYTLELDSQGNITGGRWISYDYGKDEDHRHYSGMGPDYLWKMRKYPFMGNLSSLNTIYRANVADDSASN